MTAQTISMIQARSRQIEGEWPGITPTMEALQIHWQEHRPKIWEQLLKDGLTEHYPRVLEQQLRERVKQLRQQNQADALSQARLNILEDLMKPELQDPATMIA